MSATIAMIHRGYIGMDTIGKDTAEFAVNFRQQILRLRLSPAKRLFPSVQLSLSSEEDCM